ISTGRDLHRKTSQGGQAGGPAHSTEHQVRVGDKPQDCESARPHRTALAARAGRRGDRMKRREFITALAGAPAWAPAARAQNARRVIGVLGSASYGTLPGKETAFIEGLRTAGFIEGKNISIEWRWAEGQYDRLSSLAGDLLSRDVAVIVTWDAPASLTAK